MNEISEDITPRDFIPQIIQIDKKYVDSITTLFKHEEVDIKVHPSDFDDIPEDFDGLEAQYIRDDVQDNEVLAEHDIKVENDVHQDDLKFVKLKEEATSIESKNSKEFKQEYTPVHGFFKDKICKDCGQSFCTKKLYRDHFLTNHMKDCYKCEKCKRIFSCKVSFLKHKCYECNYCGKIMSHKYGFHRHMITHGNERSAEVLKKAPSIDSKLLPTYECDICSKLYRDKIFLKRHLRTVHYGLNYSCQKCGKQYTTERPCIRCEPALLHVKCPVCEREFTRPYWQRHLRFFHKARTINNIYKCLCCSQDFSNIERWIKHLKSNSHIETKKNSNEYSCAICSKEQSKMSHLIGHLKNQHKLKHCNGQFECLLCHETFLDVISTKDHIQSKSHLAKVNEAKLKCNNCGKAFNHIKTLNSHMATIHRI